MELDRRAYDEMRSLLLDVRCELAAQRFLRLLRDTITSLERRYAPISRVCRRVILMEGNGPMVSATA